LIYVTADIHGNYELYTKLLRLIRFSDEDTLYVLGDVVDRGREPMRVLLDMMARPNVIPLIGNHEVMALKSLRFLNTEISEESLGALDEKTLEILLEWQGDGGEATMKDFARLSSEEKEDVLDYLSEFSLYEELEVNGTDYVLVHAGLENFSPDRPLWDYEPAELLFTRADYSIPCFPDRYLVTGHTPTLTIPGNPRPGYIYRANNHIAIDCGCGYGQRLGALCLDTGEEFYAE